MGASGCCNDGRESIELAERKTTTKLVGTMNVSDEQAWKHVDSLWKKHGLQQDESLDLERARPFIT